MLVRRAWRGVRELAHVVQRAALVVRALPLSMRGVPPAMRSAAHRVQPASYAMLGPSQLVPTRWLRVRSPPHLVRKPSHVERRPPLDTFALPHGAPKRSHE
jgi:hypothetical protein